MELTRIVKILSAAIIVGSIAGCTPFNSYQPPIPEPGKEAIESFPPENLKQMQADTDEKKLALALITVSDPNKATVGMEDMLQEEFRNMPDYVLYTQRVGDMKEFFNVWRDYAEVKKIDALISVYHGSPYIMVINDTEFLYFSNISTTFTGYDQLMAPNAIFIDYSCWGAVGGDKSVIQQISNSIKCDAVGSLEELMPETVISADKRTGELTTDSTGRVTFNFGNFAKYDKLQFNGKDYPNSIATTSFSDTGLGVMSESGNGATYFVEVHPQK